MAKIQNAAEIWTIIETLHSRQGVKFGKHYFVTLDNGITYLYQVLPDGRLLSIDDWFCGYVSILGNEESGIYYVVKFQVNQICIHEYALGIVKEKPTAVLKFAKKYIEEVKADMPTYKPVRLRYQYMYKGQKHWIIEICNRQIFVYNIDENSITQKDIYNYLNYSQNKSDYLILYRFPFAPHRYGLVTDFLNLDPNWSSEIFIMDFDDKNLYHLGNTKQKFFKIVEIDNDSIFFQLKKSGVKHYIACQHEDRVLKLISTAELEPISSFNRFSKLKLKRIKTDKLPYNPDLVQTDKTVSVTYPFNSPIFESTHYTKSIVNIESNPDKMFYLSEDFVHFLEQNQTKKDFVPIDGEINITDLGAIIKDSDQLYTFNAYCESKLLSQKHILNKSYMKVELLVNHISHGETIVKDVEGDEWHWTNDNKYRRKMIPKTYYADCCFNLSIRVKIDFDSDEFNNFYDENSNETVIVDESVSLSDFFDFAEEDNNNQSANDNKSYKNIVYINSTL